MRKSIKKICALILTLSILLVSASSAQAATYSSIQAANAQLGATVTFTRSLASVPVYFGTVYDENSHDGYITTYTENGQQYKVRTRQIELEQAGIGPINLSTEICTLCPGTSYTVTTSSSISVSSSFSINYSVTAPLNNAIISSATASITCSESLTRTASVSVGESYSFPANYIGQFGTITYWLGSNVDKYKVVSDRVPIVKQMQNVKVSSWNIINNGEGYLRPALYNVLLENGELIQNIEVYPDESIEDWFIVINGDYYYYAPRLVDTLDFNSRTTINTYFNRAVCGKFMVGRP